MTCREILSVLDGTVKSVDELKVALIAAYPSDRISIEQVFSRYPDVL